MKKQKIASLGIDVSKKYLDIYCLPSGYFARYENTRAGLEDLRAWIQSNSIHFIIFEPSGGYERDLRTILANHKIGFSLINTA